MRSSSGDVVSVPVMGLHFMKRPGYTAKDYVRDGLVAMWDGVENAGWGTHDPNATTWKDLVGGKEMPNRVPFDNYTCLSINAAASYCSMPAVTSDMTMTTTLRTTDTISWHLYNFLSYGTNSFNSQGFTLCSGDDQSGGKFVAYYRDGYGSSHRIVRFLLGVSPASEHNLVMSFVYSTKTISCYVDGVFIGDGQIPDDKYVSGTGVLNFGSNVVNAGELSESTGYRQYNILLYNRALTAEEIAANYKIDKRRFNLP